MSVATLSGSCLHGGESTVEVRSSDYRALYRHIDTDTAPLIPFDISICQVQDHSVSIGRVRPLRVVEHLFSALYGLGLFCVRIDVHGQEVPFFDGSSREFGNAMVGMENTGPPAVSVSEQVEVADGNSFIRYMPSDDCDLVTDMCLIHPHIGVQRVVLRIDRQTYVDEIMPARTFVFTSEDDPRLRDLPRYGIGITARKSYSAEPLRFCDEAVRHKVLDLLGDLYVLGRPIAGRISGQNTSHRLNLMFARKMAAAVSQGGT